MNDPEWKLRISLTPAKINRNKCSQGSGGNLVHQKKKKKYKLLLKEIKENLNKWKDILCSWIGRFSIVKMAIFSKFICILIAIPIKTPTASCLVFAEMDKRILKFMWNCRGPKIMSKVGELTLLMSNLLTTVIKMLVLT